MIRILLFFIAMSCCNVMPAIGQENVSSDSLFIVTYTIGEGWDQTKSPGEQQYFKEHSGHLNKLRKDGVIKFGARYADKGIIVVAAVDMRSAKEIIHQDHAIINKLFVADIQTLNVFYDGCIERKR